MTPTKLDPMLDKYLRSELSRNESAKVEAWLCAMRSEKYTGFNIGRRDEDILAYLIQDEKSMPVNIFQFIPTFTSARSFLNSNRLISWSVPALAFIIAVTFYMLADRASFSSSAATTDKIILNDGSIAIVSPDARLAYSENSIARHASFYGQGLFELTKFPLRPFMMRIGEVILQISGSCFINAHSSATQVHVLTGSIEITHHDIRIADVMSGQSLEIRGSSVSAVSKTPNHAIPSTYLQQYNLRFENADIATVVYQIQRKFDITITLAGGFSEFAPITSDFTNLSLSETLNTLSGVLDLDYVLEDDIVKMTLRSNHAR